MAHLKRPAIIHLSQPQYNRVFSKTLKHLFLNSREQAAGKAKEEQSSSAWALPQIFSSVTIPCLPQVAWHPTHSATVAWPLLFPSFTSKKKKKTNKNYAQITDISSQLCSPLSTAPAQCPCQAATVWTFPPMMHSRLLQSQHVFTESSWCSRTPHHKPQPYTEIIPPSKKDKTLRQKAECRRYPPSAMLRGCTRRTHEDLFTQANKSPNKAILCHYSAQNLNLNQINSKA